MVQVQHRLYLELLQLMREEAVAVLILLAVLAVLAAVGQERLRLLEILEPQTQAEAEAVAVQEEVMADQAALVLSY